MPQATEGPNGAAQTGIKHRALWLGQARGPSAKAMAVKIIRIYYF